MLFTEKESRRNIYLGPLQAIEDSIELVLNGLHATRFRPFQESPHVEEKSQGSEAACKVLQSNIRIPVNMNIHQT